MALFISVEIHSSPSSAQTRRSKKGRQPHHPERNKIRLIDSRLFFALALFIPFFVIATGFSGSTSVPFRYSENDLKACVRQFEENETRFTDGIGNSANNCLKLYQGFLKHYRGGNISTASLPSQGYVHFAKTAQLIYHHNRRYLNKGFKLRLNQFADTSRSYSKWDQADIHEVEEEGEKSRKDDDQTKSSNSWHIDLESFWEEHKTDTTAGISEKISDRRRRKLRWKGTDVRLLDTYSSIMIEKEYQNQEQRHTHLRQSQGERHQQQENNRNLKWKTSHEDPPPLSSVLRVVASSKHQTKVMMPGDGTNMPAAFSSPQVPFMIRGTEVELHKGRKMDLVQAIRVVDNHDSLHKFSESLDWSTSYNPDGVPLVHGVFDQGSCGSCWAFAATGSVEASAARNTARDHFVTGLAEIAGKIQAFDSQYDDDDDDDFDKDGYYTMLEDLIEESRRIESDTFEELNLSIQELLDCDTSVDEGCVGGNPLLAFYYIHRHGLVPWKEYPYVGYGRAEDLQTMTTTRLGYKDDTFSTIVRVSGTTTGENTNHFERTSLSATKEENRAFKYAPTCENEKVSNPIATVESWGLLHKNHEDLIKYALLYVGPVAVGINAADPSFINYGGGIFDGDDCDQTANHALLIVGYGEEDATDQEGEVETIRYWIARNSWGKSWGENGFVRVKRGSGEKGMPGVCGIARSPSIALGGIYRPNRTHPLANRDVSKKTTARYRKDKYVSTYDTSASLNNSMGKNHPICDSMFSASRVHLYNGCTQFSIFYDKNQPIFLAFICLLCAILAMIPLAVSMLRQHRLAVGNRLIFLEHYSGEDLLSEHSRSSSGTLSERTHLLTLKDVYADARKQEEEIKRPRGRSIVMTSPEQDPFYLVPSATFDNSEDSDKSFGEEAIKSS